MTTPTVHSRTALVGAGVSLLLSLGLAPATAAQVTPGTITNEQKVSGDSGGFLVDLDPSDEFGGSVSVIGDLDGDGRSEIAVGAIGDDDAGGHRGAIWILHPKASGALQSWSKITTDDPVFGGDVANYDEFAHDIDLIGDLDDDGVPDLIVGAPADDDACCDDGAAWILFLNADGTAKHAAKLSDRTPGLTGILGPRDLFGSSVTGLGDLDGDGVEDVAVGAPSHNGIFSWSFGGGDAGAIFIFLLNTDGSIKSLITLTNTTLTGMGFPGVFPFALGNSLTSPGDIDGNGVPDLVAGATGGDGSLLVLLLEADGSVIGATPISEGVGGFLGPTDFNDQFADALTEVGDLDGNGVPDIAVGDGFNDDGENGAGAIWLLFLEADGSVRGEQKISATAGGFTGPLGAGDQFGAALTEIGDLANDGTLELVVGVPFEDDDGNAGGIWVISIEVGPWFNVGFGLLGTNNKPRLEAEGLPLDGELIELKLSRGLPGATAHLVIGGSAVFAPFKGGTLVPAVTLLIPATVDPLGKIDLPALWPPGFPPGLALWFQWWIADPVGVQGFSASNGLQVLVP